MTGSVWVSAPPDLLAIADVIEYLPAAAAFTLLITGCVLGEVLWRGVRLSRKGRPSPFAHHRPGA